MATDPVSLLKEANRLIETGAPFCIVTVVDARGSIPQEIGAKAIIDGNGLVHGTIGGGKIEAHGLKKVRDLLAPASDQRILVERVNLYRDIGMTCAGEMTLVYEVFRPDFEWNVTIFGAGHVAQKLCRLAVEMDCKITCIDTRPEWLDRLPDSNRLKRHLVTEFSDGVEFVGRGAFVVVMTMGHTTDLPVLRALWSKKAQAPFIGALGSNSKAAIMRRELKESGVSDDFIERIRCPIGEKFGDNTPSEIAVSILTQLVRERHALRSHGGLNACAHASPAHSTGPRGRLRRQG
jgi:xanthine dehydrogenase accessory factor